MGHFFKEWLTRVFMSTCPLWCIGCLSVDDDHAGRPVERIQILAFGDSLTSGVGGSGYSYPRYLAALTVIEILSDGVPGDTAAQGSSRFQSAITRVDPDLVIICLGINDFLRNIPADQSLRHIRSMLIFAEKNSVNVLLLAVPNPHTGRVHDIFLEINESEYVQVDLYSLTDVWRNQLYRADLVHLNKEGYRALAENLKERLDL